jgi:hypothetical protein
MFCSRCQNSEDTEEIHYLFFEDAPSALDICKDLAPQLRVPVESVQVFPGADGQLGTVTYTAIGAVPFIFQVGERLIHNSFPPQLRMHEAMSVVREHHLFLDSDGDLILVRGSPNDPLISFVVSPIEVVVDAAFCIQRRFRCHPKTGYFEPKLTLLFRAGATVATAREKLFKICRGCQIAISRSAGRLGDDEELARFPDHPAFHAIFKFFTMHFSWPDQSIDPLQQRTPFTLTEIRAWVAAETQRPGDIVQVLNDRRSIDDDESLRRAGNRVDVVFQKMYIFIDELGGEHRVPLGKQDQLGHAKRYLERSLGFPIDRFEQDGKFFERNQLGFMSWASAAGDKPIYFIARPRPVRVFAQTGKSSEVPVTPYTTGRDLKRTLKVDDRLLMSARHVIDDATILPSDGELF